jgi:2,3-bisphosphoglycerate-independent phosphoglycerate mutase
VKLPDFFERYGKKGAVISAVPLCQGIARLIGLEVILVEGATGEINTNYEGKAEAALNALMSGLDFVAVHVEAPDECTHNGDTAGKIKSIEYIDARVVTPINDAMTRSASLSACPPLRPQDSTSDRSHDGDSAYVIYDSREDRAAAYLLRGRRQKGVYRRGREVMGSCSKLKIDVKAKAYAKLTFLWMCSQGAPTAITNCVP